jgi:hypothetical protein
VSERKKKLHRINDDLALGWTGPLSFAKEIVGDLHRAFHSTTCSYDQLKDFLARYPVQSLGREPFALVGWVTDVPTGKGVCFRWDSTSPHQPRCGSPQLAGTGEWTMASILGDRRDPASPASDVYTAAAGEGLYDLATLQMDELVGQSYQRERFGFAYEVLVHANGRFEYVDDVLFMALDVVYDVSTERGELTIPLLAYKYRSFDTFSVVRIKSAGGAAEDHLCESVFEPVPDWQQRIVPVGSSLREVLRLRSQFYCAYWRLEASDGLMKQGAYVCTANAPNPGIYIAEIAGQEHLAIWPGFAKHLYEEVKKDALG